MKINATRLQQHFEAMSEIGKIGETGTCRPTLTVLEKQGFELLVKGESVLKLDWHGGLEARRQLGNCLSKRKST